MKIEYIYGYQPLIANTECELPIYKSLTGDIFTRIKEHPKGLERTEIFVSPQKKRIEITLFKRNKKGFFSQKAAESIMALRYHDTINAELFEKLLIETK